MQQIKFEYKNFSKIKTFFNNEIVIFPTDTIWGLGTKYSTADSLKRIYKIKNRDFKKPIAILIHSFTQIQDWFEPNIQKKIEKTLNIVNNNTITIIAKTKKVFPYIIKDSYIGFRIPRLKILQEFIIYYKHPIAATSINISGNNPYNSFHNIKKFAENFDCTILTIDEYRTNNIPSTVIKIEDKQNVILRQGCLDRKLIDLLIQ